MGPSGDQEPRTNNFQRAGLYVEQEVRWYDHFYDIKATGPAMSCGDTYFCPLPGDPASRKPAPITSAAPVDCVDMAPPNTLCTAVKCAYKYWPGCSNSDIISGGFCASSCSRCPAAAVCLVVV
ncbi:hypothetical protein MNEG_13160 [Monoraphidium neglectum]|uniref:Uncharacterized protein n=1 Tax=Monoraphidium neglectum TaxID=145388 RepID=A0A0D2KG01_9CHLO|nr:hypothetical protein MNEG_13160 [Monoraphidium neglectum]KIY94803.1 hypothetical protein MNEG_13160 [Monoraphidium neglectum]|eukprot:XP_013893823.1 hypothetical protein MNEG_13160 [Monoraphidium neglectum]